MDRPIRQLFRTAFFAALTACATLSVPAAEQTDATPSAAPTPDPSSADASTTTNRSGSASSKIDKFAAKLNRISDALNALAALKQTTPNSSGATPTPTDATPADAMPTASAPASPSAPDSGSVTEAPTPPAPHPAATAPRSAAARTAMGIRVGKLDSATAAAIGDPELKGTLIVAVYRGSPAETAGLKAGDIILDAGGQPFDLAVIAKQRQQGQPTSLHVRQHGGQLAEFTIPVPAPNASAPTNPSASTAPAPSPDTPVAEAATTSPDPSTIAGTYRCRAYNVGGAGRRPPVGTPPLILNADGTYSMSSEHGTYTVQGDTLLLSRSTIRGPGKLNGNQVVFEYDYKGLHHVVTYQKQ